MSLETKNFIYVITCHGCNEYYIGETSTTLRARIRVHKQQINHAEYRQSKFYKILIESNFIRKEKEKFFITR